MCRDLPEDMTGHGVAARKAFTHRTACQTPKYFKNKELKIKRILGPRRVSTVSAGALLVV